MTNLHTSFNDAMDLIIEAKLEDYEKEINQKLAQLEKRFVAAGTNPYHEILQQKEICELLGIGHRRLRKWVERGLNEIRIDNRVYYRYSDLMAFIENSE